MLSVSPIFFLFSSSPILSMANVAKHASFFSSAPGQTKKLQQPPYLLRRRATDCLRPPVVGSHYINKKMSMIGDYFSSNAESGEDALQPLVPYPPQYPAHPNIMQIIKHGCQRIITRYGSGNTEAFYQRMLLLYLYENGIPSVAEIDCFVLNSDRTPVLVGRIDIEVQHNTILELKVAPQISEKHIQQLRKYVNARIETGMHVANAAVICFTDKEQVDIRIIQCGTFGYKNNIANRIEDGDDELD